MEIATPVASIGGISLSKIDNTVFFCLCEEVIVGVLSQTIRCDNLPSQIEWKADMS